MNMDAMRTERGQVYSPDDLGRLVCDAGFTAPDFHPLKAPPGSMGMLVARNVP